MTLVFCFISLNLFAFRIPISLQQLVHEADIIIIGNIKSVPKNNIDDKWNHSEITIVSSPVETNYLLKGKSESGKQIFEFKEDLYATEFPLKGDKPYIIFAKFNKKKSQYDVTFFTAVKDAYTIPLEISSSKSLDSHGEHGCFVTPVTFKHKMLLMTIIGLVALEDKNYNQEEKIKMLKLDASDSRETRDKN